jgi:hypothetical protein
LRKAIDRIFASVLVGQITLPDGQLQASALQSTPSMIRSGAAASGPHSQTKEADMRKVRDLQDLPSFQHLA